MRHGASTILIRKKDRAILMQHRSNLANISFPDYWGCPGGAVEEEDNGDFYKAAGRELYEETGYVATDLHPLIKEEFTRSDGVKLIKHIFYAIYDEEQEIQNHEGVEMRFMLLSDFVGKKIVPNETNLCAMAIKEAEKKGLIQEIKERYKIPLR